MSTIRRRLALSAVLALTLVTLTGCFKVAMNLNVKDNDTVDGSIVFAVEKQYAALAGDQALSDAGLNPSDLTQLGAQVQTKTYDDGTYVGQEVDFTGAPLDQFAQSMGASSATSSDTFSLTHADGQYVFDASMDMSGSLADQAGGDAATASMLEGMLSTASFAVSVTFPGSVVDTNGTVDGNTVTWNLDLTGPNTLHAVADEPHGLAALSSSLKNATGMSLVNWGAALLVLLLLAGLGYLGFRHRNDPAPEPQVADEPASDGAPTVPPEEPPAPQEEPRGPPAGPTG